MQNTENAENELPSSQPEKNGSTSDTNNNGSEAMNSNNSTMQEIAKTTHREVQPETQNPSENTLTCVDSTPTIENRFSNNNNNNNNDVQPMTEKADRSEPEIEGVGKQK